MICSNRLPCFVKKFPFEIKMATRSAAKEYWPLTSDLDDLEIYIFNSQSKMYSFFKRVSLVIILDYHKWYACVLFRLFFSKKINFDEKILILRKYFRFTRYNPLTKLKKETSFHLPIYFWTSLLSFQFSTWTSFIMIGFPVLDCQLCSWAQINVNSCCQDDEESEHPFCRTTWTCLLYHKKCLKKQKREKLEKERKGGKYQ